MEVLVGLPYKDGGLSPEEGFDCWGLTRWVVKQGLGVSLPEKPMGWRRYGEVLPFRLEAVQRYDILFFVDDAEITTHIGVANDGANFTHANVHCQAVVCEPIRKYKSAIKAIGRINLAPRN